MTTQIDQDKLTGELNEVRHLIGAASQRQAEARMIDGPHGGD
jgi:hypothetical protein